ncbi:Nucleoporin NUP37 [Golovinomyces cichoracearum]|uniref:Nucleoporin NUP37 n=1 Tax=Golovinomyces cichoracearum TaxID=62708 RepID=A0A420IM99_9PEZI|nr:Nucleoporin NUP37 [Golovinomyces cichoracearum]
MIDNLPQPDVTRSSQSVLIRYEVTQRTNALKVYPIKSCNGSTIILIGHENGVKIVWRGGRKFKFEQPPTNCHKVNGSGNIVVSLDSDDEVITPMVAHPDQPEFEEEEEEDDDDDDDDEKKYETSFPYLGIVQNLDLSLGSAVLQLAVLPSTTLESDQLLDRNSIIFVAACADNSLRLVTLPITPPSPSTKARPDFRAVPESPNAGDGKWGEKIFFLNGHNKPSDCVSIAIDSNFGDPHYIIASCSLEVNGRLLIWRNSVRCPCLQLDPFQSIYLVSPARTISFNPSSSRPNYLLVAETTGACRIFDNNSSNFQAGTVDFLSSSQCRWLISIMTTFPNIKSKSTGTGTCTGFGRKTIADAQWILDGCAIIVLLNDGEWGIWDIEGLRMDINYPNGLLNYQGIKGGSKSEFNLTGFIDSLNKARKSGPQQTGAPRFIPLTPGTQKSLDPFNNQAPMIKNGKISLLEIPTSSSTRFKDVVVLFHLGETYTIIPSILKYWTSYFRKDQQSSSLFGSESSGRTIKLQEVGLLGERCSAVAFIPIDKIKKDSTIPEIVILGEHRFVILNSRKNIVSPSSLTENMALFRPSRKLDSIENNQLNVTNIEMALERMGEKNSHGLMIYDAYS